MDNLLFGGHDDLDLVAGCYELAREGCDGLGRLGHDDFLIVGVIVDASFGIGADLVVPVTVLLDLGLVILDHTTLEILEACGIDALAGHGNFLVDDIKCLVGVLGLERDIDLDAGVWLITLKTAVAVSTHSIGRTGILTDAVVVHLVQNLSQQIGANASLKAIGRLGVIKADCDILTIIISHRQFSVSSV